MTRLIPLIMTKLEAIYQLTFYYTSKQYNDRGAQGCFNAIYKDEFIVATQDILRLHCPG